MRTEDVFVKVVNQIKPEDNLKEKVMTLSKSKSRRRPPVLKYAVSFVLAVAILAGGALYWPMQPIQKNFGSISVTAPQTGFIVIADAATKNGSSQTELKPGRQFQISDESEGVPEVEEGHGQGKEDEEMAISGLRLKCVGNDIQKVTYTINRGEFQQLVQLNLFQKTFRNCFQRLPKSDKDLVWATQDSVYSPVGTSQEVGPDFDGMLYLKESEKITDMPFDEIEHDVKFTTKIQQRLFNGTKIKIDVLFKNGTQSTKTVKLKYPDQEPGDSGTMTAEITEK